MINNQNFVDIKTKKCCSNKCLNILLASFGLTVITVITVYALNPYGINDLVIEYYRWFIKLLRNHVFIDNVDENSGENSINPEEGIYFHQVS